jgi:hypothetical protein
MSGSTRARVARRVGLGALVVAGFLGGGFAVASAANQSPPSSTVPTPPSSPPSPSTPPFPHRLPSSGAASGTLSALSDNSITVTERSGTTQTYTLTDATTYRRDGMAATRSDLSVGERVFVVPTTASATASTKVAASVDVISVAVGGTVVSVTGGGAQRTIVVADPQGFWRTIRTSASTTYRSNGAAVTNPQIAVGSSLVALGTIAADHTTLNARTVELGRSGPGFGGPGGFLHPWGPPGRVDPGGPPVAPSSI